jgi:hypothetical protein
VLLATRVNPAERVDSGLRYETFEKDVPPDLQENILKLARDSQDGIWIVTIAEVFR